MFRSSTKQRQTTVEVGGATPKAQLSFRKQIEREYIQGSAIDPSLYSATVRFLSDTAIGAGGTATDEISEALNWGRKQAGFSNRNDLQGAALINEDDSIWQVKLSRPLAQGFGKDQKLPKMAPKGNGSTCFLPVIPPEIRRLIGARHGVEIPEIGRFWDWVAAHPEIPVTITEGGKKALSLLSKGYVAIAVYGVNAGYQVKDPETKVTLITPRLIPDLLRFLGKGRMIVLAFDQDATDKAREKVAIATGRFGRLLVAAKCKVNIALWEVSEGKGIDDAIVKAGDRAEAWLEQTISGAPDFEQCQKDERKARMMRLVLLLNSNQVIPERETEGEYLPELPALEHAAIHLIQCGKGGGKSTEISRIIRTKNGGFTVIFVPNNPLGRQIAKDAGIPHIHDHNKNDDDDTKRFWELVKARRGVCLCLDSIGALTDCDWLMKEVDLIVFDEVNQTLANIAQGGTTKDQQGRVLESLAAMLRMVTERGGSVLGAEAIIYQRSVEFLKTSCGTDKVKLFSHKRSEFVSWDVELFEGSLSGFVGKLFSALADDGKKIMLMVSSQVWAEKLEIYFNQVFAQQGMPSINIIRLDSKTNDRGAFKKFYDDPDTELGIKKPDLLICSPSVKSGVSIKKYGFDEVWGIFTGLHPDLWAQMTARYRVAAPRKLFIKPFIQPYGANERVCSVRKVQQRLEANQKGFAQMHGIDMESLIDAGDESARLLEIESATAAFIAAESTATGAQKTIAKDYFIRLLEDDGHRVTESTKCQKDPQITNALAAIHEELERQKGDLIADIEEGEVDSKGNVVPRLRTLQEQYAKADEFDESEDPKKHLPTWIKELLPLKLEAIEEAPGVDFNDPETCYRHLAKDYGLQWRGVELQALKENLVAAHALEKKEVEANLNGRIKLPHKLPQKAMRAKLIELCGVSALLNGESYHNEDPRAIAIKTAALRWKDEIYGWLGLQVNDTQTPVEICNKFLGKLGLKAEKVSRPGTFGKRDRIYEIPGLIDPYRNNLLDAMRRRLRGFDEASVSDSLEMLRSATVDREFLQAIWATVQALPECDQNEIWARLTEDERQAILGLEDATAA